MMMMMMMMMMITMTMMMMMIDDDDDNKKHMYGAMVYMRMFMLYRRGFSHFHSDFDPTASKRISRLPRSIEPQLLKIDPRP